MEKISSQDWLMGPRPNMWWTGKKPSPGFYHSLPQLNFNDITRQDLLNYFDNVWTMTEILFSALQGEQAFTRAPIHQLRHPLVFYYGHPAVLYVNKLRVAGLLNEPVNPHFESLFEVGVDEMSWDDMSKNEMRWPAIREITEYRRTVYNLVKNLIMEDPQLDPKTLPISQLTKSWALVMAFEHEKVHLETSSVLIRELPLKYLSKPSQWPSSEISKEIKNSSEMGFVSLEKGLCKIGKPNDFPTFGWDNEYGHHELNVAAFKAAQTLTTNLQYLEFVNDGGYRESKFWSKDGWNWRSFRNTKAPTFWVAEGPAGLHEYSIRRIFDMVPFQPDWPVIVNFHEAKAFCRWKTLKENSEIPFRLTSEAEHHRLRTNINPKSTWNTNLKYGSEVSVNKHTSNGIGDIFGNVWQWCEDEFNPLPGFAAHPYYEDFSTPCFDGKHQMIMGGSFASTGAEAEPYARFHFRPHFFQHAGFRVIQSAAGAHYTSAMRVNKAGPLGGSDYESSELLSQYLLLHFSDPKVVFPFDFGPTEALSFPQRCASLVIAEAKKAKGPMKSVLDLGCAVGGSSFVLSQYFESVTGVDLSSSFIAAANHLKAADEIEFDRKDQGEIRTRLTAKKPKDSHPERIQFLEADACNLPPQLNNFDAVMMANLLCRLPDPKACLAAMSGKNGAVRPGGLLILFSPYSWLEQHTARAHWLGARRENNTAISSSDEIKQFMDPDFNLLKTSDVPLLIREHERKYQYIVSHLMVFQRKAEHLG